MRLHRLEVTAFGPFSGTEEIDFDALSDAGLFLIQGQTGAGKTSVLDAVCYALYGQVPGARNAVKGLRSDHAAPDVAPRVVLEATIRGRRLRVTRSPAWDRPKIRGSGTTQEKAKVLLEELEHGEWTGLSTRLDEAGDLIGGLLGMTAAQFCQVAMLPQGEFASFLRANAEERRKVLERLFAAEVFTQVEKWLADRRAATGREAAALRTVAGSVADRVAEATGAPPPRTEPAPPSPGPVPRPRRGDDPHGAGQAEEPFADIEALPAWAAELAGQHAAIEAAAAELRDRLAGDVTAARTALDQGRVLAERRRAHAEARHRQERLRERAGERAELTSRLDAAARADRVLPLLRNLTDRTHRAKAAQDRAALTRSRVAALVAPGAAEDVLAKAERTRRDDIAALDGKRALAARLAQVTAERHGLSAERARLEPREAEVAADLDGLPGQVEELRAACDDARITAAGRAGAEAAVQDARRRLADAERRDRVLGRLAEAEETRRLAVDAAQAARDRLQELRQARLEGMAATLAADLRPGEPCRVCGALEHPEPAAALGLIPGEDDEERAQAAYEEAQRAREEAAGLVESLRADRDAALESVGETPARDLAAALGDAERALEDAVAAAAEAERLEARLRRAERDLGDARDRHGEIERALTANHARDGELGAEQDRLRAELDRARGDDPSLEARVERLTREAEALAAGVRARQEADRAAEELAAARAEVQAAAANEGFRTADEVRAAELADEDQAVVRDRVRRFDDEEAAVRATLADPALTAASAEPPPDLPALESVLALAESAHTAAASAAAQARRRRDRLAELRAELADAVRAWRPAAERHRVAERLAGLASGKAAANRLGMSLSAYVLAARLEQVVAAANERLDRMSAGRYALRHTVDRAAGDRSKGAGGLGLRVVDGWTGRQRDPVTLSGGESFITSLALALGLADVVTAEAGGTEINTLFVDEGFGTLDEETLDEVMDVLDGLRDGGRAVGIVSHVAELRTRIPAQLRVTKRRAGSTARVVV
ncbi:SMC family ATPase [Actinomadura viridis]|uniref:Nuclease SbcCD subunit C n=1 Tax=Actinomadura viridis TaxID=58110 RepID=A0A931DGU8_9ACTN|nr:SMC family ATPase [Actinomadura viridis]MBG6090884.1 exonuclease SbcC [Actinomadura viridis]